MKKHDKLLHFAVGIGIAAVVGLIPYLSNKVLFDGVWTALFSGFIAGAVKEYTDYTHTKVFDGRDLVATVIGAVCVVVFIICLHIGKG